MNHPNILIIRTSAMGDIVMSSPLAEGLRKKYPQARVCWLAEPQVKELLAEHCDQATVAKRTGLQSFVVRNYIPMSRQYAAEELKAAVNDCVQMEEDVKTGKISDLLSVELLITKYSRAA